MLERVMRVSLAARALPSVTAGRISVDSPVTPLPGFGSACRVMLNKISSIGPSQKLGTEIPKSAITAELLSTQEPGRSADAIPSGSEMISAIARLARASWKVAGILAIRSEEHTSELQSRPQ